MKFDNLIG